MDNIYQSAIRAVEQGAKFKIDFRSRNLKINGKPIIRNGEWEGELGVSMCGVENFLAQVEELYRRYKHSVPSERSESKSRRYFKALPESHLDDDAMMYGENRDKAQVELELYILCQILSGLEWEPETMGKWFWQSKTDKDLVILRNWVEPAHNNIYYEHEQEKRDKIQAPVLSGHGRAEK